MSESKQSDLAMPRAGRSALTALLLLGTLASARTTYGHPHRASQQPAVTLPAALNLEAPLRRCGLSPELFATLGATAEQTQASILLGATALLASDHAALQTADDLVRDAARYLGSTLKMIANATPSEDHAAIAQAARDALALRESERDAILDALFSTSTSNLPPSLSEKANRIRRNLKWRLPIEFLVKDREENEWLLIRRCLTDEETATELEMDPNPDLQQALAALLQDSEVALAKTNCATFGATIRSSWESSFE